MSVTAGNAQMRMKAETDNYLHFSLFPTRNEEDSYMFNISVNIFHLLLIHTLYTI